MAIIRTSAIVAGISGSIGGVTFSNARRGLVARQRKTRTTPATQRADQQRVLFANATRFWQTLTDEERTSWRAAARDFPQTNRISQTSARAGYSLFLTVQINRARIGDPMAAAVPMNILGTSQKTLALIMRENQYSVRIEQDGPPEDNTHAIVQGVRHFSTIVPKFSKGFREITTELIPGIGSTLVDYTTDWQAIFGTMVLGEAWAVRIIFYDPDDNMLHQTPIDFTGLLTPAG